MAPRGIVAAAVSAIFARRLAEAGSPQAEQVVVLTCVVIVGTVLIYGLMAPPLATWLQLASPDPQGLLIVGAHPLARGQLFIFSTDFRPAPQPGQTLLCLVAPVTVPVC